MSKYFLVRYKGLWMGGNAVVIAKDRAEAVRLVRNDSGTLEFTKIRVKEIKGPVLYNDNGDY